MSEVTMILIINDDPVALRLTQRTLDEAGYETAAFTSAADAVSALAAGLKPQLIVADLHMPGIDGWKLCRLLRGPDFPAFNQTPILVVSATFTGVDVESITADLGANAFLPAPFHPDTLRTYVSELLQGAHPQRSLKVLVVDDDPDLAETLGRVYREHGYEVETVGTGREAVDRAVHTRFDVYVLDYHLPDTDGGRLMRELRRPEEPGVVLIMTGDDSPELPVRLLEEGAEGYLRKPFDARYLIDITQKARRERSLLRVEALLERRTEELKESDARMRALFRAIPDWVVVVNWQGVIVQANEAAFRSAPEGVLVVGRPLRDFLAPEGADAVQDQLSAVWSTGRGHFDAALLTQSGERDVEVAAEVTEMEGDPVLLLVARDVTARRVAEEERRRLEARAQHAQRMESLGVLAGGIAHDFNNLLVGILGNASLALMEVKPGHVQECLDQIEQAARRAAELTNQILTFAGQSQASAVTLQLESVVREAVELVTVHLPRGVELDVSVEPGVPEIDGDPVQLRQLLVNLLENAGDALEEGAGSIRVQLRGVRIDAETDTAGFLGDLPPHGPGVEIQVEDTGKGMDSATRRRAFEPFFTTKFTGRGLGLAAALGIVQGHGGMIRVESEAGRGTRVRVVLPRQGQAASPGGELPAGRSGPTRQGGGAHDPAGAASEASSATAGSGSGDAALPRGKILVADDEPTVLRLATTVLKRAGYSVFPTVDGDEAYEVFMEAPASWDLVLADLAMPGRDGRTLIRDIRAAGSGVPVLLSSGYDGGALRPTLGEGAEPVEFLPKPYRASDLHAAVRLLLDTEASERPGGS